MSYADLLPFCTTDTEKDLVNALIETGSMSSAASKLNRNQRNLQRRLAGIKDRAAKQGYSPSHDMTHTVPNGFSVKGVSTLYDDEGNVKVQWVKSNAEQQKKIDNLKEIVEHLIDDLPPYKPSIKAPRKVSNLLSVYPMGDPHIGMYAWADECGDDFDADIAERNLCEATRRLVECSPASEQALIVNVGDFFHADSLENKTMRSGHQLDVDTRWPRVLKIGINAMRTCVDAALAKHKKVKVVNVVGNHDDHTAVMLSLVLDAYFRKEKRVEISTNPGWFHYHKFGNNLIGMTHGDKTKPQDLPQIMAADQSKEWGDSKHRYWYTGHIHHDTLKEYTGCKVESFRTLAAKDAYTASHGYRSGRDMQCIILDKEHGEVERHRINIEML